MERRGAGCPAAGEHEAAVLSDVEQHLDEIRNSLIRQYADAYDYEEFTSDIPNVSEEATKDLDDNGIIYKDVNDDPNLESYKTENSNTYYAGDESEICMAYR